MASMDTKLRLLRLACEAAGGSPQLAARLGVSHAMLARWLCGGMPLPDHIFLDALDLMLEERERQSPAGPDAPAPGQWQH